MKAEWKLTIGEVLKHDLFRHATVVAGSIGLSRPIRWVHSTLLCFRTFKDKDNRSMHKFRDRGWRNANKTLE